MIIDKVYYFKKGKYKIKNSKQYLNNIHFFYYNILNDNLFLIILIIFYYIIIFFFNIFVTILDGVSF